MSKGTVRERPDEERRGPPPSKAIERELWSLPGRSYGVQEVVANVLGDGRWWTVWALTKALYPARPLWTYRDEERKFLYPRWPMEHRSMLGGLQGALLELMKAGLAERRQTQRQRRNSAGRHFPGRVWAYRLVKPYSPPFAVGVIDRVQRYRANGNRQIRMAHLPPDVIAWFMDRRAPVDERKEGGG